METTSSFQVIFGPFYLCLPLVYGSQITHLVQKTYLNRFPLKKRLKTNGKKAHRLQTMQSAPPYLLNNSIFLHGTQFVSICDCSLTSNTLCAQLLRKL